MFLLWTIAAQAVQDEPGVPVGERPRPDYEAPGIRAGAFLIYPELTLKQAYNDNIYSTKDNTVSDWITAVSPNLEIKSDWGRHMLGLETGLEFGFFWSESQENYIDGQIILDGRLDVARNSSLLGQLAYLRRHDDRGLAEEPWDWDEPSVYYFTVGQLEYRHSPGRLALAGGGNIENYNFRPVDLRDGTTDSQSYRDRNHYNLRARVGYEVHPDMQPFIEARYNWRRYDESGVGRDSEGYRIGAGSEFDLPGLFSGEAFAGYMQQEYYDREDISSYWIGAELLWSVTELTSIEGGATKSVEETRVIGASGIDSTFAHIKVVHELLRNLLIAGFFDFTHNSYKGRDITDKYYHFGPRLTYLWNPNLHLEGEYGYRFRDSNLSLREYTENKFQISITGAF